MFFLIPRLSFGHKNILREGMRVIFDITRLIIVLSPHPIIEISDNQGLSYYNYLLKLINAPWLNSGWQLEVGLVETQRRFC